MIKKWSNLTFNKKLLSSQCQLYWFFNFYFVFINYLFKYWIYILKIKNFRWILKYLLNTLFINMLFIIKNLRFMIKMIIFWVVCPRIYNRTKNLRNLFFFHNITVVLEKKIRNKLLNINKFLNIIYWINLIYKQIYNKISLNKNSLSLDSFDF
jgi:hypothetical protein